LKNYVEKKGPSQDYLPEPSLEYTMSTDLITMVLMEKIFVLVMMIKMSLFRTSKHFLKLLNAS